MKPVQLLSPMFETSAFAPLRPALAAIPVLMASLLLAPHSAFANKFVAAWIFPTSSGSETPAVAEGDFNGDGIPDLVVVVESPAGVAVLLGNGDGTFQAPLASAEPSVLVPKFLAVGDFNGDGKLDVVVANEGEHKQPGAVTVMLGNGDGTFQSGTSYAAGTDPYQVVVGDFNNDGKLDVAALNSSTTNVSVLLGNGDGTLQTAMNFNVSDGPAWLGTGDFNGDGNLDLVTANGSSDNVTVLLGNGNGTFQAAKSTYVGGELFTLAVGDLNNDGQLDLAVLAYGAGKVLLGNGDGTFQAPIDIAAGAAASVTIADVNHDGNLDVLVGDSEYDAGASAPSLQILLGNGDGTFKTAIAYSTSSEVEQVVVADFNLDGNQDVAGLNNSTPSVGVVLGKGDGTFSAAPTDAVSEPGFGISADFNNDGIPDLAITDNGDVAILLGKGDGTFQPAIYSGAGDGTTSVAAGDFNGDGKLDVALNDGDSGSVAVLLGNGDGTFQAASYYETDSFPSFVVSGDVNGDGKLDLVVANAGGDDVSVLLGNGDGTFQATVNYDDGGISPYGLVLADFNGDGKLDIAVANSGNDGKKSSISVMLGNGDGSFGTATQYSQEGYTASVTAGDLNGDGNLDLVVAGESLSYTGTIGVLLGHGDGTFKSTVYFMGGMGFDSAVVADFNGDGRLDVAAGDYFGNVNVFYGNANGSLQTPVVYGAATSPGYVATGDFNLDGAPDLAASNVRDSDVSVMLNTGGTYITTTSSPNPSTPGQAVTLTATVVASTSIPGAASPTGSVTFYDGTTSLGTVPLTSGTATLVTSSLSLGTHTITAAYLGDANFNPHTGSPITQTVTNGALAVLNPTSLTFGSQNVGSTSAAQSVTLSNTGTAALSITNISTTGDFGQTNNCGSSVAAATSCTIMVTFTPTATGTRTGTLSVTDNAPGSPQSASLTGTGTQPLVTLSPASLTFPTQLIFTSSPSQAVTLTNTGTGALTISAISMTGNFTQTNNCGASVLVGSSCQINVAFRPAGKGTLTGTVMITDNAPGSPQSVALTGTGTVVQLTPVSVNFGDESVGHTSPPATVTLTNVGKSALSFKGALISGADSGDFAQTNNCGSVVAGGSSCQISVTFTPSAKGARTASLKVSDNGGGSPQVVSLQGTGE